MVFPSIFTPEKVSNFFRFWGIPNDFSILVKISKKKYFRILGKSPMSIQNFRLFFYQTIAFIHTKILIPHWSSLDMCEKHSTALKSESAKIRISPFTHSRRSIILYQASPISRYIINGCVFLQCRVCGKWRRNLPLELLIVCERILRNITHTFYTKYRLQDSIHTFFSFNRILLQTTPLILFSANSEFKSMLQTYLTC